MWNGPGDILAELSRHPFPRAGSLLPGPTPSNPIVSAGASERFLVLSPAGPFKSATDYYNPFVDRNMALIADGQLVTIHILPSECLPGVFILEIPDSGIGAEFKS